MDQPSSVSPEVRERDASAWQGTHHTYPEADAGHAALDLPLHAWLGRFTGHVSPAALTVAWFDWSMHLMLSPDKQAELATHAASATLRWLHYCAGAATASQADAVEPLAQDKRFVDPAWHRWPFNVLSQGFLLQQQWWHRATRSVRGMSAHNADVTTFVARQLLDSVAPSNFVLTNPVVLQATCERGGMNLVGGMARAASDASRPGGAAQ
jgi:polyhydroxyalkanoate synthase